MADALDYGDVDEDYSRRDGQDDVDMETDAQDARGKNSGRHNGPKLYQFPTHLGVEAGANRGPEVASEGMDTAGIAIPWDQDPSEPAPEVPTPIGGGRDLRMNALHLTGTPVSKLSTSRLFAYLTHFGAQPLGIEWINDTSVNVVFTSAEAAHIALEYMCSPPTVADAPAQPLPSTQQITEAEETLRVYRDSNATEAWETWPQEFLDSLLLTRKAHCFPRKLYTGLEKDAAKKAEDIYAKLQEKQSEYPEDVPEIYRDLEEEERRQALNDPSIQTLKVLHGTMWVRFCIESADIKRKDARKESKWYKEHGGDAGKDVVPKLLQVGTDSDKLELLPSSSASRRNGSGWDDASGLPVRPDFAAGPSVRASGSARNRAVMDDLDEDLDAMRAAREAADERRSASPVRLFGKGGGRGGRGSYRGRGSVAAAQSELDEEMDQWSAGRPLNADFAGRSLPPHMALDGGSSESSGSAAGADGILVRGRGRKKAPPMASNGRKGGGGGMHGWDDDDDYEGRGSRSGGMRGWDDDSDDGDAPGGSTMISSRRHGGKSSRNRSGKAGPSASSASLTHRLGAAPGAPSLEERMGESTTTASSLRDRLG